MNTTLVSLTKYLRLGVLSVMALTIPLTGNLAVAEECFVPAKACTDDSLKTTETNEGRAFAEPGSGQEGQKVFVISYPGWHTVKTNIPVNDNTTGSIQVDRIKISKPTCVPTQSVQPKGDLAKKDEKGFFTNKFNHCGRQTINNSYEYRVKYNAADGIKTATYKGKDDDTDPNSPECGQLHLSNEGCKGPL